MYKKILSLIFVLAFLSLPAFAQGRGERFRVSVPSTMLTANTWAFVLGRELGVFTAHDVDLKLEKIDFASIQPGLFNGEIDATTLQAVLYNSVRDGECATAVVAYNKTFPGVIVARKGIRGTDIRSLGMSTTAGFLAGYARSIFAGGIQADFTQVSFDELTPLNFLTEKLLDAIFVYPPSDIIAEKLHGLQRVSADTFPVAGNSEARKAVSQAAADTHLIATCSAVRKNPAVFRKVTEAVKETVQTVLDPAQKARVKAAIASTLGFAPGLYVQMAEINTRTPGEIKKEVVDEMYALITSNANPSGVITPARIDQYIRTQFSANPSVAEQVVITWKWLTPRFFSLVQP